MQDLLARLDALDDPKIEVIDEHERPNQEIFMREAGSCWPPDREQNGALQGLCRGWEHWNCRDVPRNIKNFKGIGRGPKALKKCPRVLTPFTLGALILLKKNLEAWPGIEPGYTDLQSAA